MSFDLSCSISFQLRNLRVSLIDNTWYNNLLHCIDSQSSSSTLRRIFPTCMDVHKWHWHELSSQGIPWVLAGRHLSASQSKFADDVLSIWWCLAWLFTCSFAEVQDNARPAWRYTVAQGRCFDVPLLHRPRFNRNS